MVKGLKRLPSPDPFFPTKTCILLVRDNVIQRVPVQVQLEDGVRAKVNVIVREAPPESSDDDIVRELTPRTKWC